MARTKAFNKQEVLTKAMELFWEKGFHATSIQDLVARLGINRASMYDTFGGKDQLFMQSLQLYLHKVKPDISGLRKILKGKSTKAFLSGYLYRRIAKEEVADPRGCFAANTTCELSNENEEVCSVLVNNMDENVKFFEMVIRIGQERGEIDGNKDPHDLAGHLFVFFNGLNIVSKLKPDGSLSSIVKSQLDFLFT